MAHQDARRVVGAFEVPAEFNPVSAHVKALEAKKQAALEEYQKRVADINEQLSKLQALECAA